MTTSESSSACIHKDKLLWSILNSCCQFWGSCPSSIAFCLVGIVVLCGTGRLLCIGSKSGVHREACRVEPLFTNILDSLYRFIL